VKGFGFLARSRSHCCVWSHSAANFFGLSNSNGLMAKHGKKRGSKPHLLTANDVAAVDEAEVSVSAK
jgi:hypothetical protein